MRIQKTITLPFVLLIQICAQPTDGNGHVNPKKIQFVDNAPALNQGKFEKFTFPGVNDPYLLKLKSRFELEAVVSQSHSDLERVRAISKWVRSRWEHNGGNTPEKSDPISILQEAEQGRKFRCVEYAIVVVGALNSIGIPARTLGLMTKDVETTASGAGHVVAEAYLPDSRSWVMIDGQWDVIPTLKGKPLSAVKFALALEQDHSDIELLSLSGADKKYYLAWVKPYLYYFRSSLITSYSINSNEPPDLVLGPIGSSKPTIFQRKYPLGEFRFTHSLNEFYFLGVDESLTSRSTRTPPALSPAPSHP